MTIELPLALVSIVEPSNGISLFLGCWRRAENQKHRDASVNVNVIRWGRLLLARSSPDRKYHHTHKQLFQQDYLCFITL